MEIFIIISMCACVFVMVFIVVYEMYGESKKLSEIEFTRRVEASCKTFIDLDKVLFVSNRMIIISRLQEIQRRASMIEDLDNRLNSTLIQDIAQDLIERLKKC